MRYLALLLLCLGCGPQGTGRPVSGATLKFKGLFTTPNQLEIPEGGAVVADNVVCRRDDVAEPRRGVSAYATLAVDRIASYGGTLIAHTTSDAIQYDNGSGTFTAVSGTFAPPSATVAKTRFALAGQDLFFTTSAGVYRMDSTSATPARSGAIKAPGFERDGRVYTSNAAGMSLTANVVTVATTAAHGFYVGQVINQTSATEAPYVTGNHTVLSVPSSTSFTYAQVDGNDAANANPHTFAPAALVTAGGFLADGFQAAYRCAFNCPDANNTEKPGAASPSIVVANATGTLGWVTTEARNVVLRCFVPTGVTTSHSVRLYRTKQFATSVTPDDEMGLVYEALVKQGEITAGYVDITDVTPDALRGASGYFVPSQQGIAQNNDRPPLARDITAFGGSMHYAYTTGPYREVINLLGVGAPSGLQSGDLIEIRYTSGMVQATAATTPTNSTDFKLETSGSAAVNVRNTALNLCATINRALGSVTAFYISGADDLPGKILLEGNTLGGEQFTVYLTGAAGKGLRTAWAPMLNHGQGFQTWDLSRTSNVVTATPMSGVHNLLVGEQITITNPSGTFGAGPFTITSVTSAVFTYAETGINATVAARSLVATSLITSSNDAAPNRVYHSKTNLFEAVPLLNYNDVGDKAEGIQEHIALRSSMFAFKRDGLFKGTGSNGSFGYELFDPTIIIVAPDSAVALGNQIYAWTTQGILAISDTGSEIVSRPIEKTLNKLIADDLTSVQRVTFGVARETEGEYELRTITTAGDTTATQAFIYNTRTGAWTRDTITARCGLVNPGDDTRYLGGATQVLKERKAYAYTDYSDADVAVTIASSNGTTSVTLASSTGVTVGDILTQSTFKGRINAINGNVLTTDESVSGWTAAAATIKTGIASTIQYAPFTAGNPDETKLFQETNFLLGNGHIPSATVSYSTELIQTFESVAVDGTGTIGQWTTASATWDGTERPFDLRICVPQEERLGARLNVKWAVRNAWSVWNLSGLAIDAAGGSKATSR